VDCLVVIIAYVLETLQQIRERTGFEIQADLEFLRIFRVVRAIKVISVIPGKYCSQGRPQGGARGAWAPLGAGPEINFLINR